MESIRYLYSKLTPNKKLYFEWVLFNEGILMHSTGKIKDQIIKDYITSSILGIQGGEVEFYIIFVDHLMQVARLFYLYEIYLYCYLVCRR